MSFTNLGLNEALLRAVEKAGYTTPTPIQQQAIPILISGKDVLGTAQTGTGKTAAFALPMIQLIASLPKETKRVTRGLIIVPTRELAVQIQETLMQLARFSNLRIGMFFGGVSKFGQINMLKQGIDIAVATPGRLLDLMRDHVFHPQSIKMVVLDEADQMLDMGFLPDIKTILNSLPKPRQAALFSATMPEPIANLAHSFLVNPERIAITPVSQPLNQIRHQTIKIEKNQKLSLLMHLLKNPELKSVLIFVRTKRGAKRTAVNLTHQGHQVVELHGNQSQAQRQFAMRKFKEKHVRILVATDLASRGIDIDQLSHVINFDMPETPEAFLHRTGRTGRAGFSGDVINFVSREEYGLMMNINRHTKMTLSAQPLKDFVFDPTMVVHGAEGTGDDSGYARHRRPSSKPSYGRSFHHRSPGSGSSESQGAKPSGYSSPRPESRGFRKEEGQKSYQGQRRHEDGKPSNWSTPRSDSRSFKKEEGRSSYQGQRSSSYDKKPSRYPSRFVDKKKD
jgi:ATP-dependent RNA helicase RhlE